MLLDGKPEVIDAVFAFVLAGVLSLLLVPLAERLAWRIGAIDRPRERSIHLIPKPKLGGLAILVGVLVSGFLFLPENDVMRSILGGAALIALVGAVDDVVELGALPKLVGQIAAVSIPVAHGVTLGVFTIPLIGGVDPTGVLVHAPLLGDIEVGQVITVLGITAAVNAINFIDGVDGLASGVCLIAAGSLAVIALSLDRNAAGVMAAIIAGASLGFLRHGFPPASSFMGDAGSNLLGYMIGIVAIQGALKTNTLLALFFPLVVLAVPILDSSFVVLKRLKNRQPVYVADRSHLHHRMANIGFSQRRTLFYMYGWATIMAGLALALRFIPYSDDRGNFDPGWTVVMAVCGLVALAASIYLIYVLEILKLRRFRFRQSGGQPPPGTDEAHADEVVGSLVDEEVHREVETGEFRAQPPGGL